MLRTVELISIETMIIIGVTYRELVNLDRSFSCSKRMVEVRDCCHRIDLEVLVRTEAGCV